MVTHNSLLTRLGVRAPIVLAPMAGTGGVELAVAVARAGGLGSLPAAMLSSEQLVDQVGQFRAAVDAPVNANFFCHTEHPASDEEMAKWLAVASRFDGELGVERRPAAGGSPRRAFDDEACAAVERCRPQVVSFHFGLPDAGLVERVKATGALVVSSATTVAEAVWLEAHGCDVVIAQGAEAGGHRGMFLTEDVAAQPGTMALVPRVVDAVTLPVIAAGGIADSRGIIAALALGASAAQIGTAYLLCPEALTSAAHRRALAGGSRDDTVLTNVFTGRPARGRRNRLVDEVGPMSADAPPFPMAAVSVGPLRAAAEAQGSGEFSPLWSGQRGVVAEGVPAYELTVDLVAALPDAMQRAAARLD